MEDFDTLKSLWQQAPNDLPSAKEVLDECERSKRKMKRKTILTIVSLSLTFAFITFIAFYYEFEIWTTKAGILLTLASIAFGIFCNTDMAKLLFKNSDAGLSNSEYLDQLKTIRNKQRNFQTRGISIYFLLLTTGIVLYMLEFAIRNWIFGLTAYGITLAWIAFNWFYIRKKMIRKQTEEINKQIGNIERLVHSLKKED